MDCIGCFLVPVYLESKVHTISEDIKKQNYYITCAVFWFSSTDTVQNRCISNLTLVVGTRQTCVVDPDPNMDLGEIIPDPGSSGSVMNLK